MNDPVKPDHISQEAWDAVDVPEFTDEMMARARPFAEVHPELAASLKNQGGRPRLTQPTVKVGWRFPADLVAQLRGTGKGYTDRIEALLRDALKRGAL